MRLVPEFAGVGKFSALGRRTNTMQTSKKAASRSGLAALVLVLAGVGAVGPVAMTFALPVTLVDDGGADDAGGQKDLSQITTDAAHLPDSLTVTGIQQLRLWHPAWLRSWPFGLTVRGLHPVTKMRQERCRILPEAVGKKEGHTARSQQLHDVVN